MAELRVNLQHAVLVEADQRAANLEGANLIGANLSRANLTNAKLGQTILARAKIEGTIDARDRRLQSSKRPAKKNSWWKF